MCIHSKNRFLMIQPYFRGALALALALLLTGLSAQSSVREFELGAAAYILDDECIRLTPDRPYISGSAWHKKPIDLNNPFEMIVCLVLGEKDDAGADGIAFVFHPAMRTGFRGEGMGFSGLIPSLGIEFDTYQNFHLNDPAEDHLAVMANGSAFHGPGRMEPVLLPNLEDGTKHLLRITWDPIIDKLSIYLNRELRTEYSVDLVNDIFGGDPRVFWGVTAATGRLSNYQDICIKKLVYAVAE
jgi:hypothetical protein